MVLLGQDGSNETHLHLHLHQLLQQEVESEVWENISTFNGNNLINDVFCFKV